MKSKGYTLIELLAVFVILGIIVMITVTIINGTVKSSKESAYKQQINQIENVTKTYMSTHSNELPSLDNVSKCITVETLKNNGLLKNKDIKNPVGQTEDHEEKDEYFDGGVLVLYDGNKYTYKYVDDCNNIDESDLTYKAYSIKTNFQKPLTVGDLGELYSSVESTGKLVSIRYTINNNLVIGCEVCFLKDGSEYCLTGGDEGKAYSNNKSILSQVFGADNCTEETDDIGMLYSCNDYNDPMSGGVYNDGQAYISNNANYWHCGINDDGTSTCFID